MFLRFSNFVPISQSVITDSRFQTGVRLADGFCHCFLFCCPDVAIWISATFIGIRTDNYRIFCCPPQFAMFSPPFFILCFLGRLISRQSLCVALYVLSPFYFDSIAMWTANVQQAHVSSLSYSARAQLGIISQHISSAIHDSTCRRSDFCAQLLRGTVT
jgi:hypothetical protein